MSAGTVYESNIAGRPGFLCKHCWRTPSDHGENSSCLDEAPPIVLTGAALDKAVEILTRRGKL